MKVPVGMTEKEVLDIIDSIAKRLSYKFRFGYHSLEDIEQQARYWALTGLPNYDGVRPLENFLWVHVRNRLYNDKRKHYSRLDPPCFTCPFYNTKLESCCEEYADRTECELYSGWESRNASKQNIMNTVNIELIQLENEPNMAVEDFSFDNSELIELIDKKISVRFREDWIRLKNNLRLSKLRKDKLLEEIYIILDNENINIEVWQP